MELDSKPTASSDSSEIPLRTSIDRKQLKRMFLIGVGATLISATLWGINGTWAEYIFSRGASAEWLVNIRLLSASALSLTIAFIKEGRAVFAPFKSLRDIGGILVYGLIGILVCQFAYFKGISLSNAGTACVIQYVAPVIIIFWTCISDRRLPLRRELIALVLAIGGVFLISTHGDPSTLVISSGALIWSLISAFGVAVYTVQPRRMLEHHSPLTLIGWAMLIGGLVITPYTQFWAHIPQFEPIDYAVIGLIVVFGTTVTFNLFMVGMKIIGPVKAALIASIEPLAAATTSALWLGSVFAPADMVGFVLILSTVFVTSLPLLLGNPKEGQS